MRRASSLGAFAGAANADAIGDEIGRWLVGALLDGGVELTCHGGIPSGTVVAPPNEATWTPGLAIEGTGVYIPYGFEFSAILIPDEGDPVDLGTEVFMKKAPKNTKSHLHGVCTFSGEERVENDPDFGTGVIQFSARAHVFWTG